MIWLLKLGNLDHLVVLELSRMRQILQTVLAAALCAAQNDNMVLASRHIQLDVFFVRGQLRPDDLKADELGPNGLLQTVS